MKRARIVEACSVDFEKAYVDALERGEKEFTSFSTDEALLDVLTLARGFGLKWHVAGRNKQVVEVRFSVGDETKEKAAMMIKAYDAVVEKKRLERVQHVFLLMDRACMNAVEEGRRSFVVLHDATVHAEVAERAETFGFKVSVRDGCFTFEPAAE